MALAAALLADFVPGLRLALGAVCHQNGGAALCARCAGVYAGLIAAGLLPLFRRGWWPAAALAANAGFWLAGIGGGGLRFGLGFVLAWSGGSWLITLMLCPNTARAERNCRPTRDSAIVAASPSAKNP